MQEKVIGILGGMGPYATVEFYRKLLELNPVVHDKNHPRMIIDSNVKIPSRTRAVLYGEETPVCQSIEAINNLANVGADFVALPCNQIHYWYREIVSKTRIPWLNMVEMVSARVKEKGFEKPLVLGGYVTTEKKIYSEYLPDAQYFGVHNDKVVQKAVTEVKNTGRLGLYLKRYLREQVDQCEDIDSVLLACTELTGSMTGLCDGPTFDSSHIYAQGVLKFVGKEL